MNEEEIAKLAEKVSKGKPINIFIRIAGSVSALAGLLAMFLPFGKIMYYHPESVSLSQASKYGTTAILLLFAIVLGLVASLGNLYSMILVGKKKTTKAILLSIIGVVFGLIALILCTMYAEQFLWEIEYDCRMRVDRGIAYYASYICIFISLALNITSAIIVSLIHSGKTTVEKMFHGKS